MTNDGVVPDRTDLFECKRSASAPGLKSRGTRSGCGPALRMAVLTPLLFCAGLGPADAGQKALLIGAGEYPFLPKKSQLARPPQRCAGDERLSGPGMGVFRFRRPRHPRQRGNKAGNAGRPWRLAARRHRDLAIELSSTIPAWFQVDDESGDERDGKDETFVPTDFGRNGERAEDMLLDDELANALNRLRDRPSRADR